MTNTEADLYRRQRYDPQSEVIEEGRPCHLEPLMSDGWVWQDEAGDLWHPTFAAGADEYGKRSCEDRATRLAEGIEDCKLTGRPVPCRLVLVGEGKE